jgi:hypothetical protein
MYIQKLDKLLTINYIKYISIFYRDYEKWVNYAIKLEVNLKGR